MNDNPVENGLRDVLSKRYIRKTYKITLESKRNRWKNFGMERIAHIKGFLEKHNYFAGFPLARGNFSTNGKLRYEHQSDFDETNSGKKS